MNPARIAQFIAWGFRVGLMAIGGWCWYQGAR